MEKRKVTTIPATLNRFTAVPVNSKKKRRVAGYARVSTDHEEQLTSYEAQVDYYTNYIKSRPDWDLPAYIQTKASVQRTPKDERALSP